MSRNHREPDSRGLAADRHREILDEFSFEALRQKEARDEPDN